VENCGFVEELTITWHNLSLDYSENFGGDQRKKIIIMLDLLELFESV
jgi:hypothetical protein